MLDKIQQIVELPMDDGTMFQWNTANLQKIMRAPDYQAFLQAVYAGHPGTPEQPWRIILSEDELVPGALLRIDKREDLMPLSELSGISQQCSEAHNRLAPIGLPAD